MNLVIDSGNSAAKVGIFDHQKMVEKLTFPVLEELQAFMHDALFDNLIISSVKDDEALISSWGSKARKSFALKKGLPLPVNNLYKTPETLGMDRLAAVCGAQQLYPRTHCLVIDAGTCITYDFLDKNKNHHGGSIAPGLKMRLQAMHTFTAKLPLVEVVENPPLIGDTTTTCLQSGAINGMIQEINGTISQYQQQFEGIQVILCGGDARFFENKLKAPIFAIPELVLSGLNSILIYNVGS